MEDNPIRRHFLLSAKNTLLPDTAIYMFQSSLRIKIFLGKRNVSIVATAIVSTFVELDFLQN